MTKRVLALGWRMMTAMRFGLPKDHKLANYWLRKALDLIRDGEDNGRGMMDDDIEH